MRVRQPAVAGRFYSGHPHTLDKEVSDYLSPYTKASKHEAVAVISPHAGYFYSGAVAAETLSNVHIPETVIILGLNHHGRGAPVALSGDSWNMVLSQVDRNEKFCDLLLANSYTIVEDNAAHEYEHSVEVQIPFLLKLQPSLKIVPVVLSHLSYDDCETVAEDLVKTINQFGQNTLIVASSDMSHYVSRQLASQKDKLALDKIEQLDPRGLYETVHTNRISMCGVIPVTVALLASTQLGATHAEVIRYTDSGEMSGDTDQVVGYAGVTIS